MKDTNNIKDNTSNNTSKDYTKINVLLVIIICICVIIFRDILGFYIVSGNSMYPTYKNLQVIKTEKFTKADTIDYSDIVIADVSGKKLIKRVVGLPGDIIEIKNHELYLNGTKMPYYSGISNNDTLWVVETDTYFILGDNFNNSKDSRVFGSINRSQILRKVTIT